MVLYPRLTDATWAVEATQRTFLFLGLALTFVLTSNRIYHSEACGGPNRLSVRVRHSIIDQVC